MRISDWSSDVCSSDLGRHLVARAGDDLPALVAEALHRGMADAPAGAGQHHPLALSIAGLASIHGAILTRRHRPPYRNPDARAALNARSEEHTSELQSLMRISYAVFCLKKKNKLKQQRNTNK